jgi:hypothetical protein
MTVKKFGDLQPGDFVLGSNGEPVEVVAAYDEHLPETMWEIELDDGVFIKTSGNHLWYCETRLDWELHSLRKAESKKALKGITPYAVALLEETAAKEEIVETSLVDMVTLLQAYGKPELMNTLTRIAEAIGHIAETTTTLDILDENDHLVEEVVRMYDASIFANQILALTGRRKYRKTHVIVGSIMTTDQMMELSETVEIPVTQPLA